jgi:hypothetical protein
MTVRGHWHTRNVHVSALNKGGSGNTGTQSIDGYAHARTGGIQLYTESCNRYYLLIVMLLWLKCHSVVLKFLVVPFTMTTFIDYLAAHKLEAGDGASFKTSTFTGALPVLAPLQNAGPMYWSFHDAAVVVTNLLGSAR